MHELRDVVEFSTRPDLPRRDTKAGILSQEVVRGVVLFYNRVPCGSVYPSTYTLYSVDISRLGFPIRLLGFTGTTARITQLQVKVNSSSLFFLIFCIRL